MGSYILSYKKYAIFLIILSTSRQKMRHRYELSEHLINN